MILLDATTKKLQVLLSGAVATTEPAYVAGYADLTSSGTTLAETDGTTSGASAVDVVSAPGASTVRKVTFLNVHNRDTTNVTVTVRVNNNGTTRILAKVTLPADYTLVMNNEGWSVISDQGQRLGVGATGAQGIQGIQGPQGEQGPQGDPGATHDEVTLAGSLDYLTISGQQITRNAIDLATDVSGRLPFANFVQATATDKLIGRSTASGGNWEEIACTAAGRSILDDASTGDIRTTLGVGTGDSPTFGGATLGGALAMQDNQITRPQLRDVAETKHAGSATTGTIDLDITNANFFEITSTGDMTFTFSNPSASGQACSITVKINYGGAHTVTWPASVRWAGSTPTATSTNSKTDIFVFTTTDGGTKWFGAVGGQNYTT